MTVRLTRHREVKPIRDVCEAIAFLFSDRLDTELYERLADASDELVHTLWNLIELRPAPAEARNAAPGQQLAIVGPSTTTQEDT